MGLSHFESVLSKYAEHFAAQRDLAKLNNKISTQRMLLANYALVNDFFCELEDLHDEHKIVRRLTEISAQLFDAAEVRFFHAETAAGIDDPPGASIQHPAQAKECDFTIPLHHYEVALGVLSVKGVAFPKHIDQYRHIAGTLCSICSKAIYIARSYRREKQLADEWRTIFDSVNEMISLVDPDFRIIRANRAFAELLGTNVDALTGRNYYDLIDKSLFSEHFFKDFENIKSFGYCETEIFASNLSAHLRIKYSPVIDREDHVNGNVCVIENVTDKKRIEKEKIEIQNQLLHSEQLATIGILAAGVSHEINNPLAIVKGFAGILAKKLRKSDPKEDVDKIWHTIEQAINKITTIIDGLRTCARSDTDGVGPMDIHKIIDEFYPFIKQLTWSDAIDIQRKFAAESHLARANSGKINQVLINLLNNSRDALLSRPFGRQIVIETISDGKCISIRFSDNGCGIPEAIINKIFDPFFTTKEVGKGTGLGLAISRVIIESFGGTLKASSKQGVGTTFEITLLCAQPPAAAG